MAWPYHFLDLSEAEKHSRRQALDTFALYSQLSFLLPVIALVLYRIASWSTKSTKGPYDVVPSSPSRKAQRETGVAAWQSSLRKFRWWLGEDVFLLGDYRGQRDQWLLGFSWGIWMLVLCVVGTGQGKHTPTLLPLAHHSHFTWPLHVAHGLRHPSQD